MNSDQPAFPMVASTGDPRDGVYCANGLSKREYAAIQLMTGMMETWPSENDATELAKRAVIYADALLAELERKTE